MAKKKGAKKMSAKRRPVKDLSAFPVCGSVRPLAAQRRTG